jgi:hypothetical protein
MMMDRYRMGRVFFVFAGIDSRRNRIEGLGMGIAINQLNCSLLSSFLSVLSLFLLHSLPNPIPSHPNRRHTRNAMRIQVQMRQGNSVSRSGSGSGTGDLLPLYKRVYAGRHDLGSERWSRLSAVSAGSDRSRASSCDLGNPGDS